MNKLWLILISGLICPIFSQALNEKASYGYGIVIASIINQQDNRHNIHLINIAVNISNAQTNVDLLFKDRLNTLHSFAVRLSYEQRQEMIQAMLKYFEWNRQATIMQYKLDKAITNFITHQVYWQKKDNNCGFLSRNIPIELRFFSQTPKDHQLILKFSSIGDIRNLGSIQPPSIYIGFDEVVKLANLLSEGPIIVAVRKKTNYDAIQSKISNDALFQ